MKTLTILLSTLIITTVAFAQKSKTNMQEGMMFKDGKTWYIKSLTGTMSLDNGVEANTDGTVKVNGKIIQLHDGDCINFQGQLIGLNQKNTTVDGLVTRKNGTMWVWSILNRPLEFKNGTYGMPDGTIKTKDGKYIKMKDKEFVDMNGDISFASK